MGISSVTSEALQLKLRQLLPSQQGFGTDLSATDTIVPIIDLTASAEGSDVRLDLQTAIAFGSQTTFNVTNSSTDIATTPGFYRIIANFNYSNNTASDPCAFDMTDGATTKRVWIFKPNGAIGGTYGNGFVDLIIFNATGITTKAVSDMAGITLAGSIRQIADNNGTLVQPSGFTPQ